MFELATREEMKRVVDALNAAASRMSEINLAAQLPWDLRKQIGDRVHSCQRLSERINDRLEKIEEPQAVSARFLVIMNGADIWCEMVAPGHEAWEEGRTSHPTLADVRDPYAYYLAVNVRRSWGHPHGLEMLEMLERVLREDACRQKVEVRGERSR